MAVFCVTSFTACNSKKSETTTSTSGVSSNGGIVAVYNGYLYFINGIKDNDGTSLSGNTRSAIYRVQISDSGEIDDSTYECVVDNLVGFDYGSIYFFGDYMYYTTPNSSVNYLDDVLYYQTKFMRYDLVNGKSYEIYTTQLNSSSESLTYSYYIVNDTLNLVVFESSNSTITSIKIGDDISTNYVIEDVASCIVSENYGTSVSEGSVDANNFVFYTMSHDTYDKYQTGVKVYMVSPTDSSVQTCLSDEGKSVSLLSIRNGKLIYSGKSFDSDYDIIYYENITGSDDKLTFSNVLSYTSYENILFIEEDDGSITILTYNEDSEELLVITQGTNNAYQINLNVINMGFVTDSDAFSMLTIVTLDIEEEVYSSDDEEDDNDEGDDEEGDVDDDADDDVDEEESDSDEVETVTVKITYLIYIDDGYLYKIEIGRYDEDGNFSYTYLEQPILLSLSEVNDPSNYLVPEVIGNYLYVFATEVDDDDSDDVYLYRVDLTITEDSEEEATIVGVKES